MSELEDAFEQVAVRICGLPEPVREYVFCPGRRWRFDFAWPEQRVACEIDGATWAQGRHVRGAGFERDCEKLNMAVSMGWRVFRFTRTMLENDPASCVDLVRDALR